MIYTTNQFAFDPQTRTFSQEASTLNVKHLYGRLPSGVVGLQLKNPLTDEVADFRYMGEDIDGEGDVECWNFVPTIAGVLGMRDIVGYRLVILND